MRTSPLPTAAARGPTRIVELGTGADLRLRNDAAPAAVLLLNGGGPNPLPGTWSATTELLARELSPRFAQIAFAELRYRIKSWKRLDSCVADAQAALALLQRRTLLVGFSMGGAVSIAVAGDPCVAGVAGLAPWIPSQLSLDALRGKRLDVIHGSWDRYLPGVPGVTPASSRRAFERARALGIAGSYTLIRGGVHGAALRDPSGRLVRLPRARRWLELVREQLARFAAGSAPGLRLPVEEARRDCGA